MLLSTLTSGIAGANVDNKIKPDTSDITIEEYHSTEPQMNDQIEIIYPSPGYLYLYQLNPIQMPIVTNLNLGIAVVIGRNLPVETAENNCHYAKFVAQKMFTSMETVRYDYQDVDGLNMDMDISTGFYFITVHGYDENDLEIDSDTIKVFYIRTGRSDFGVWINTRFDNGELITSPLEIGLPEFHSMLETGETKDFKVSLQNQDDTTVQLRFTRTKILETQENVIETRFNVDTTCDTTRDYETNLEVRFPFVILNGGQPAEENDPYFSAQAGYYSSGNPIGNPNQVNTSFYFGKDSIKDPAVFRMKLTPNSLDSNSKLTYYTNYLTIDENGNEIFQRRFSIEFAPATDLTITTIPREAKVQYDFGESAGIPTKIAFRAEGGLFNDIIQRFAIDPLPSYMAFDLTIIGEREFLYESDQTYDVSYSIDSEQNGNLVTFEVDDVPERIQASWGIDLGDIGDLHASSFAELDMSHDVSYIALYFLGNEDPLMKVENFPKNIRLENAVDILEGTGNITILRGLQETRDLTFTMTYDQLQLTKTFQLKNNYLHLSWNIDTTNGIGTIDIQRDTDTEIQYTTTIDFGEWTFGKTLTLRNSHLQLQWDVNRVQRRGSIQLNRDSSAGNSMVTTFIGKNDWMISNSIELKHTSVELYWDLPSPDSIHGEIGLNTDGETLLEDTITVTDAGIELLSLNFGIQTEDNIHISWDNNNGVISNFEWSGKLLSLQNLDLSVHLPGDIMTLSADFNIGESGAVEIELNKPVEVQFVDVNTQRFKMDGQIKFNANSPLRINWQWGELGYFTVNTYGQNLGDDFGLKFYWDPTASSNYRYGFNFSATQFLNAYVNISWYKGAGQTFPTIWIIGNPFPGNWANWHKWLLWDYQWWQVS
jgi:hypothetical protein